MPDTSHEERWLRDSNKGVPDVTPRTEQEARVQLAACYRLSAHFGLDDIIFTHISGRVPGEPTHFLLNPFGLMFREVKASNLVKIDHNGQKVGHSDYEINVTGFVIHSAIHMARPEIDCVMHTHGTDGIAVSSQEEGLLPLNQTAMRFYNRVATHDYEGLALNLGERERLMKDLGKHHTMILRHHGILTCGRTIPEAFILALNFEKCAAVQIKAQNSKLPFKIPSHEVCELTANQLEGGSVPPGHREWPALLRMLDSIDPSYRD